MTPRPYQIEAIDAAREHLRTLARDAVRPVGAMLVMATGTGKTFTAMQAVHRTLTATDKEGKPRNLRVLWLSHRDELVNQAVKTLCRLDPDLALKCGIIKGSKSQDSRQFVSASVDTLGNPGRLERYLKHGAPSLVVWDEAHHSTNATQLDIRERLTEAGVRYHLGLTATPEGLGLADYWRIVYAYDIRAAQDAGFLTRERIVVERLPNLEQKDYRSDEEEGAALMLAGVVDHTVAQMLRHAKGRHSLVFTATIDQAKATAEALTAAGIRAVAVSGSTAKGKRAAILRQFMAGEVDAIVNAAVFTEGTDLPRCNCVTIARSCRSKVLWIQTVGRGLRLYDGQDDCLVLDLAGASLEHEDLVIAPVLLDSDVAGDGTGGGEEGAFDGVEGGERTPYGGMHSKREPVRAAWVGLEHMDRRVFAVGLGSKKGTRQSLGAVIVVQDPHTGLWSSYHARGKQKRNCQLLADRVDLSTAQAMGNDLVRRSGAITSPFTRWRQLPASEGQRDMLRTRGVVVSGRLTKGKASDLITRCKIREQVIALGLAASMDLTDGMGQGEAA